MRATHTDEESAGSLSDRRRSEAALRRLATVLQDSNDAITMQDLNQRILAWNRGAVQMYGVLNVWLTTTKLVDDEGRAVAIATTERDITQRKKSEREMERLLDELTRALRARDEFLSMASHELKTPLFALKLKLEQLFLQARRKSTSEVESVAAGVEVALRQTGRLKRLVDDLLDVSRIASGRLSLEREKVNLSELARGRDAALRIHRARRLLGGAARSTRCRGSLGSPANRTGVVIPESEQARIFEQFVRAAPKGTGGLGLGLYIARQIVEAHGGRIRVESRPDEGAAFFVTLPLRRQDG
jgi:signal transduction histidine kinase